MVDSTQEQSHCLGIQGTVATVLAYRTQWPLSWHTGHSGHCLGIQGTVATVLAYRAQWPLSWHTGHSGHCLDIQGTVATVLAYRAQWPLSWHTGHSDRTVLYFFHKPLPPQHRSSACSHFGQMTLPFCHHSVVVIAWMDNIMKNVAWGCCWPWLQPAYGSKACCSLRRQPCLLDSWQLETYRFPYSWESTTLFYHLPKLAS